ncbi:MAG: sugar phosphate isomerase/epimerase [Firmicutes bacterium]|nr:sugar phosphate isomerase/epimerase [Bacillota bacterium]MCL5064378.1 sugar phosphate isomerase/epimerase [Bacillota bacterium]
MKLALQMYTLREFTKTPAALATTLRRVRTMGYEAVQLSGLGPIDPGELASMLAGEGLVAAATHVSWQEIQTQPERIFENHERWKCHYTAIASMPSEYRNARGYRQFAQEAGVAAQTFLGHGLTLAYHNHSFEFERMGDAVGLDLIFSGSHPALNAEIDTYWVQHGGADPAAWIAKLRGRVPLVHLKDMTIVDGQPTMAEVGEGNMNWPRILEALEEAGTRWYMVEQDVCQRDPFESAKISLEHLHAWGLS